MPLTKLDSLEPRKTAVAAISSGVPSRRGDLRLKELLRVRAEGVQGRRVDGAGADDVHADAAILQLQQPGARERADRRLAGTVYAKGREALDAGDGAVQDNGAVVVEERQRLLDGEEGTAYVEVEGLVEVLLGDLPDLGELALPGAGEEDVDLPLSRWTVS